MKKLPLLLVFFLYLLQAHGQSPMPGYQSVLNSFFAKYDYERDYKSDLSFAKKKAGWYIQLINRYEEDKLVSEALFWSIQQQKYLDLGDKFESKHSGETAEENATKYFDDNNGFFELYTYERCRYYGYERWDIDMINDFRNEKNMNDTLLEGLARAYSSYGGRYLYNLMGMKQLPEDELTKPSGPLEPPSKERIEKFRHYIDSSIALYKQLAHRTPSYRTRVGNAKMKLVNEQFHIYQQLSIAGYDKEATEYLQKINPDPLFKQIGYNYLNSCPPNSILITFGDNDTYPLWYVQQKEGFRKDVAVINNSLMGVPVYIEMLKRKKIVAFSSKPEFYGSPAFLYSIYKEQKTVTGALPLTPQQLLQLVWTSKYPQKNYTDETIATYPQKNVSWKFDPLQLKKVTALPGLGSKLNIELPSTLPGSDLFTLDIAITNFNTRPILFTATSLFFADKYQHKEGLVYRLLPLDETKKDLTDNFQIRKDIEYMTKFYKPIFTQSTGNDTFYGDTHDQTIDDLYGRIINYYTEKKNPVEAKKWVKNYLNAFGKFIIPSTNNKTEMAKTLLETGYKKEAEAMLEAYANALYNNYKKPTPLEYSPGKDGITQFLEYMVSLLSSYDMRSESIDQLLQKVNDEE